MSYFIEFGQNPDEGFYQEFEICDVRTGVLIPGNGIDHRFNVYGSRRDYGCWGEFGQTLASNANGLITAPVAGVLAIAIPPTAFFGVTNLDTGVWSGSFEHRRQSLKFKLLAVPADATLTKTLATGTITFGDRLMPNPRIKLGAYPLYPAPYVPQVDVSQVKQQLAKVTGNYDAVEAALPGPTDPATISWNTGGPMNLGGPLSTVIEGALGYDDVAMSIFLVASAANPL